MMIRHVPVVISLALLFFLGACKPEPYLNVSPASLSFSEDGGSQTVQVSANYPWTANVSGKGFSVSPSSGEGDGRVTVTASPTNEPNPVTVNLVFYCEGLSERVELHQAARNTILVGDVAKIPAEGGTFEIPVQYNTDFTVEVDSDAQSWIRFVQTKALTSGKLVFDIEENEKTDPRTGKVTVTDKSGKVDPITLTLVQEEKKVIEVGAVTKIAAEGGTYEVKIEYNTDFSVEVDASAQDWISFVETKALTSGRLVFFFKANETPDARDGKVTIRDKSGKVEPITLTFVQEEKKIIEVGEVTVIAAEGGTYTVDIAYNTEFSVQVEKSAQSWISFVETKALTSGQLVFVFAENEKPDSRKGKVTIKDKSGKVEPITLTFVQEEKKIIEVGDVTEIPAEGGTYEVAIAYNTDFSVEVEESAQDWISFVETKALTSGKMVFVFKENTGFDPRSGKVTIQDNNGKVDPITLTFVQDKKRVIEVGDVTEIPAEGGTYTVEITYSTEFSVEVEESAQSWISFVETKALTSGQLVFVFAENEKPDSRTGKVTIKDKSGKAASVTLTFVQQEKKVIQVGEVTEIPQEGGTYTVEIAYNTEFSVEVEASAQDWISFIETKALTSGQLVFFFAENTTPDVRRGKVTIKDKSGKADTITLTFVQEENKVLEVGEVTEIPAEGGTFEIEITYNTEFSVDVEKSAQSWISFVETKALTNGHLVFTFAENEKTDSRTGKVTIKDKSGKVEPVTLTFVQAEKKVIQVGDITEIPQEGGTFEVEVQFNTDFRVEIAYDAQSWITFVETKALTSGHLVFVFEENGDDEKRTGTVTIRDNNGKAEPVTLTFVQKGSGPYFRVICPEAESLSYEAGELTVVLEQNVGFSSYGSRDGAWKFIDLNTFSFNWENPYKCTITIPYSQNVTRQARSGRLVFFGGEYIDNAYTYSDTLYVCQQPATIIASEMEAFIPSAATEFSFRVAEDKTDNYRVENEADWVSLVKSEEKKGGAVYRWKAKKNTGTGMREAGIKVYLNGIEEPDVFHVYQEGPELSVSVTYSGKQVKAPFIYGPFAEKSTIWWGDESSMPYSGGVSHTYSSSGSHTITVTTKYMHFIERAEVTELEDGMHIDFSKMRYSNE